MGARAHQGLFTFGRGRAEYAVATDTSACDAILAAMCAVVVGTRLVWPSAVEDLLPFVGELDMVLKSMPKESKHSSDDEDGYHRPSLVRSFVSHAISCLGVTSLGSLRVKDCGFFMPDVGGHLQPLRTMSCDEVRDIFGLWPHEVAGWACSFGNMRPESKIRWLMTVPDRQLWSMFLFTWQSTGFPPSPRYLCDLAAADEEQKEGKRRPQSSRIGRSGSRSAGSIATGSRASSK